MPALMHHVFFWLKKDLAPADHATFAREISRLTRIAYLQDAAVGTPAPTAPRPVIDHSFDYALTVHFRTLEDHAFYQTACPEHARFVSACKAFWERVQVYDVTPLG